MLLKNKKSKLNHQLQFLISCCQITHSIRNIEFINDYINKHNIDNNSPILNLSRHHGVFPIVYKNLNNLHSHSQIRLSNHFITQLKKDYMEMSKKNMLLSIELIRIMKLMEEHGMKVLAFKGPVLSQIAYGDITLRRYGDLDILIEKKYFRFLADKLLEGNFVPLYPIETFHGDKVMFNMNNDCPFYDTKRGVAVEIHWDFFRKLALPTNKFKPWKDTRTVTINGYKIQTLCPETHLLYHSLHGSKHVWERLEWIVDLDRFIRAIPDLDWDKILMMAKSMGAQKMFLLGIALSQRYFNTPLPDTILSLCTSAKLEPFITYVESEFNSDDPSPENSLVKLSKVVGLRDNFYYKMLTVLEFLFRPGINERRMIILPDALFWLYWPLRPLGMGWRFIVCRLMKLCGTAT